MIIICNLTLRRGRGGGVIVWESYSTTTAPVARILDTVIMHLEVFLVVS